MTEEREQLGKYLLNRIQDHGADHIFTVPGDYLLGFNKICEAHSLIQVNATRENTAAFMADAYARARGLGAVAVTYGVCVNVASALSQAYAERVPLVVISAAPSTEAQAQALALHHLPRPGYNAQLDIFKPVTVDQAVLWDLTHAPWQIERVLETCLREKRPVYIEIPQDLIPLDVNVPAPHLSAKGDVDEAALEEALEEVKQLLHSSKQPVIWVGADITTYHLGDAVQRFAEAHQIPVCGAAHGKTAFSERHPLFIGHYQGELSNDEVRAYVQGADCVLVLGVLQSDVNTGMFTAKLNSGRASVFATADALRIGHHSYERVPFRPFIQRLAAMEGGPRFELSFPRFRGFFEGGFEPEPEAVLTADRVFSCIQKHLKSEHVAVVGIGDSFIAGSQLVLEQDSFVSSAFFMSLGYCVPAAIGTGLALPERRVVAIVGDGDFQMTGTEWGTACRYGVDLVLILLNNAGYGMERPLLEGEFNDICGWKYHRIPEVFGGGQGHLVQKEAEFEKVLEEALGQRGNTTLIEVQMTKGEVSSLLQRFTSLIVKK